MVVSESQHTVCDTWNETVENRIFYDIFLDPKKTQTFNGRNVTHSEDIFETTVHKYVRIETTFKKDFKKDFETIRE